MTTPDEVGEAERLRRLGIFNPESLPGLYGYEDYQTIVIEDATNQTPYVSNVETGEVVIYGSSDFTTEYANTVDIYLEPPPQEGYALNFVTKLKSGGIEVNDETGEVLRDVTWLNVWLPSGMGSIGSVRLSGVPEGGNGAPYFKHPLGIDGMPLIKTETPDGINRNAEKILLIDTTNIGSLQYPPDTLAFEVDGVDSKISDFGNMLSQELRYSPDSGSWWTV